MSWLFLLGSQSINFDQSLSLSITLPNEYSRLISFRTDWFDLLAVQGLSESSPAPQFKGISSSVFSLIYGPTLTSIHDYWKKSEKKYVTWPRQLLLPLVLIY